MTPQNKSRALVIAFSLLSAYIYYILFFIIYPEMRDYYYALSTGMIGIKLFPTFIALLYMNPGVIVKDSTLSFKEVLKNVAPRHICAEC
mmetsp:Transcript_6480/g.5784  ORF Transcript_6480/g.5784 Transcript_6480/m.5784 type:complete len:89 (+) Transcript_6480:1010-1276(+)